MTDAEGVGRGMMGATYDAGCGERWLASGKDADVSVAVSGWWADCWQNDFTSCQLVLVVNSMVNCRYVKDDARGGRHTTRAIYCPSIGSCGSQSGHAVGGFTLGPPPNQRTPTILQRLGCPHWVSRVPGQEQAADEQ